MSKEIDPSKINAMRMANESDRSSEFKEARQGIVAEIQALSDDLKQAKTEQRPLKNGMLIGDGAGRVSTTLESNGTISRIMTNTFVGAFLREEAGKTIFEMADKNTDNAGSRFVSVELDEMEAAVGIIAGSGTPNKVAGVYEEMTAPDGKTTYFGVDVMSDGGVHLRNYDVVKGVHTSRATNDAQDIQGIRELVAGIHQELV